MLHIILGEPRHVDSSNADIRLHRFALLRLFAKIKERKRINVYKLPFIREICKFE